MITAARFAVAIVAGLLSVLAEADPPSAYSDNQSAASAGPSQQADSSSSK